MFMLEHKYQRNFCLNNLLNTTRLISVGGIYGKTKKRKKTVRQYGSTIGPARYPKFWNSEKKKESMLPRPVVKCRPGKIGNVILSINGWFVELIKDIETLTLQHLHDECSENSLNIIKHIEMSKSILPSCLRICNTFFTSMFIIGDLREMEGDVPPHLDKHDHINSVLYFGLGNVSGGHSIHFNGIKIDSKHIAFKRSFQHGQLQIGNFDKVIHGASEWKGRRQVIHLSLNKKVLGHFQKYGSRYYRQYVEAGYPEGYFLAR